MFHLTAIFAALLIAFSATAFADDEPSFREQFNGELSALQVKYGQLKLSGKAAVVIARAVYCVVEKSSLKQTVAFYHDIKQVAEQTKAYCDTNREADAKQYALGQYSPRKTDPMVRHTLECYTLYAQEIASIVPDPAKRAQLPSYYRWANDPALAQQEMTGAEICH